MLLWLHSFACVKANLTKQGVHFYYKCAYKSICKWSKQHKNDWQTCIGKTSCDSKQLQITNKLVTFIQRKKREKKTLTEVKDLNSKQNRRKEEKKNQMIKSFSPISINISLNISVEVENISIWCKYHLKPCTKIDAFAFARIYVTIYRKSCLTENKIRIYEQKR